MLKMIETFSGIGAQAKALKNLGCDFEIIGTADWDITAMIAYDLIHHGKQDLSRYIDATREEMLDKLKDYTLSTDGKSAASWDIITHLNIEVLRRTCAAIDRTNNYVSVTDMHGAHLPADMNALTYSFPCQDLSVAHAWHGATEGIDRSAANRSSMLWDIERILQERKASPRPMPKFLLMENVPNIISRSHSKNFDDWQASLEELGYHNQFYVLNSKNFGMPQARKRAYLISVYIGKNNKLKKKLASYFESNDLQLMIKQPRPLSEFLRTDYSNEKFRLEANSSQPNDTPSRRSIFEKNIKLFDGLNYSNIVPTITTKQDRHPNSGVVVYDSMRAGKSTYRYLTGRECLLLMGFEDSDYEAIMDGNFKRNIAEMYFNNNKITKMAGNSIVVPVLEEVFKQLLYINEYILTEKVTNKLSDSFNTVSDLDLSPVPSI
jgi:DNA (cytosine-5)-methyltransferase 1